MCKCLKAYNARVVGLLEGYGTPLLFLLVRVYMAKVFFMSGLTKIHNFKSTLFLFKYEYAGVPLLPHNLAAYMATAAELSLPVLLVLGFFSRFAALGLIGMTLVIELFVYPGTAEHYYWLLLLGTILVCGGGKLALDRVIKLI